MERVLKLLLIYNPQAGGKRAATLLPQIKAYFKQQKIDIDILLTEYGWHSIELVARADLDLYDGVIAGGGDGTLFGVLNGYYKNPGTQKPPIGLLPVGTGNAFAKELGLNGFEWQKAIDIIAGNKAKKIDVARLQTEGETYYFINVLGFGFVSDVGETVLRLKGLGEVSYLLGVLYQVAFLKSFKVDMELDGKHISSDSTFVEIANTRYTGSVFIMAPDAVIDDGFFDVVIARRVTRRKIIKLLPTIFKGTHVLDEKVDVYKARKISIKTDVPKKLIPDGELFGSTPIEITCLHQDIQFLWR